jgi:hypothetical protein
MAYDLVVGSSFKVKDAPDIVGSIEFNELKMIQSLLKKVDCAFLSKISNLFEDAAFSPADIETAIHQLNPLLLQQLGAADTAMLHKLLAVLGYANAKQLSLFGVAD